MEGTLEDVALLLKSPRRDIRTGAVVAAAAYSEQMASSDALYAERGEKGGSTAQDLIQALLLLTGDLADGVARSVLSTLINLAADERAARLIVDGGACDLSIRSLLDKDAEARELDSVHSGLLANLTRFEFGSKALLNADGSEDARLISSFRVRALINRIGTEPAPNEGGFDAIEGAAMAIGNLSLIAAGRAFFMSDNGFALKSTRSWMHETNRSRRLGFSLLLRNCASDESLHKFLLNDLGILTLCIAAFIDPSHLPPESDLTDVAAAVQLLLDPSKMKASAEPEEEVRKALAEAMLMLCKTKFGRDAIRSARVYPLLREAHKFESNEEVQSTLEEIVQRTELLTEDNEA